MLNLQYMARKISPFSPMCSCNKKCLHSAKNNLSAISIFSSKLRLSHYISRCMFYLVSLNSRRVRKISKYSHVRSSNMWLFDAFASKLIKSVMWISESSANRLINESWSCTWKQRGRQKKQHNHIMEGNKIKKKNQTKMDSNSQSGWSMNKKKMGWGVWR